MNGGNARGVGRLTQRRIESWLKSGEGVKLADGGGLYLARLPSGGASWRIKYRLGGIERTYSVGTTAEVSLADAREARSEVKRLLKEGRDPVQARRLERAESIASSGELFEDLANAWLAKERSGWSEIHYDKSSRAIERDVLPLLGKLPVRDITPAMVAAMIESIQRRGVRDTAAKVLQHVRAIFRFAAAKGHRADNPAEPVIEILKKAEVVKHHPALLTFPELGDVLRRAEVAPISPAVRLCHRLIAFTAVRISNAVAARWKDFDLDSDPPRWIIPRAQMKVRGRAHDHRVVLPKQIAEELRAWRKALPRDAEYVFPGTQGREHLSREAVEKALRVTLGLADKHSAHGWRSSFATLAKDHDFDRQVVDLALDHIHDNEVARAYDRGERLKKRAELAAWWGDELTMAQRGADVVPLKRKA